MRTTCHAAQSILFTYTHTHTHMKYIVCNIFDKFLEGTRQNATLFRIHTNCLICLMMSANHIECTISQSLRYARMYHSSVQFVCVCICRFFPIHDFFPIIQVISWVQQMFLKFRNSFRTPQNHNDNSQLVQVLSGSWISHNRHDLTIRLFNQCSQPFNQYGILSSKFQLREKDNLDAIQYTTCSHYEVQCACVHIFQIRKLVLIILTAIEMCDFGSSIHHITKCT